MIEIDVYKDWPSFRLEVGASSSARVLGLVGPSGAGKTTMLNCIAGTVVPSGGRIAVDGAAVYDADSRVDTPTARRRIGYVFQSGLLFPHMTVQRNLRYGLGAHGPGPAFDDVVDALELGALLRRMPTELSGGEHRRVAVGRSLLSGPRLMLLDEPLTGLDRRLALRTLAFLATTLGRFNVPAVYVSHSLSDVVFLCDEAWVLSGGRLAAAGPPRTVLSAALTGGDGAGPDLTNVFTAAREAGSPAGAAVYRLGDQRLVASPTVGAAPERAILSVPASDIILSRVRPERISARNILRGRVIRVVETGPARLGLIDVGVEWMVELTPAAVEELELRAGAEVFAIVKASAVAVVGIP